MALLIRIANTLALLLALAWPAAAQDAVAPDGADDMDALFASLADPDAANPDQIAADIRNRWSQSGSGTLDLLLRRGRSAIAARDFTAAVEHFTALTDHAPGFAEAWHGRAQALFLDGRIGAAIGDLRRTLALEPRHFEAWAGLGAILMGLDRPAAALEAWQRALELNPHIDEIPDAAEWLDIQVNGRET